MALAFTATKGKAVKKSFDAFEYKDGENTVRLIGGILPRYVYWLKGTNGKDIPVECLAFDRDADRLPPVRRALAQRDPGLSRRAGTCGAWDREHIGLGQSTSAVRHG